MGKETTLEKTILENIISNEDYCRKVLPHLKEEYFDGKVERVLFSEMNRFHIQHNKPPNKKILSLFLDDYKKFKQEEFELAKEIVDDFSDKAEENVEWLVQRSEKFCRDKAIYNGIMKSISIMDGTDKNHNEDAIPVLLSEALSISFDKTVGHDYLEDISDRYTLYHTSEDRIPFHLEILNKITKGGVPKKTLNAILAGTGAGKSLMMCDFSANYIVAGYNVLYITMEMAEERIAERIDCNLMDVGIGSLQHMKQAEFESKMSKVKNKSKGRLVIKEYPTSSAHAGHFRALLEELKTKKNFIPDVVCVDYLNICASQRYKGGANYNSYFAVKAIAEELRGLAVEYNFACWTATQATRGGNNNSDIDMGDTSESFGTPMTLDFFIALMRTEELDEMGQVLVKQLKSRYNDINFYKRFVLGIDLQKFKFYDVESPTSGLTEHKPKAAEQSFEKSKFGNTLKQSRDFQTLDFG